MSLRVGVDVTGLQVTFSNPKVLPLLNKTIHALVSTNGNPLSSLEQAVSLDKQFLFGEILVGCMYTSEPRFLRQPRVQLVSKRLKANEGQIQNLTWREQQYAKAFEASLKSDLHQFQSILCDILVQHPTDCVAHSFLLGLCIFTGSYEMLRDGIGRTIPFLDKSSQFYPYVLSFYAFGLEETNFREEAASLSHKCLSLQPQSPWAAHTISHVVEESRDPQEGVDFLLKTRKDWEDSGLGHHISWHLMLHYLDMDQYDNVLKEYDAVVLSGLSSENTFGLVDASSLLWRLELAGHSPGEERWKSVVECFKEVMDSRGSPFLDLHMMLTFAHGKVTECAARTALAEQLMKSLENHVSHNKGNYISEVTEQVGAPVCQALLAFGREQYDQVLSLLLPLRYKFINLGGSWAQRQVVTVTVIKAAIEANQYKLALSLIAELKALKPKNRSLQVLFEDIKTKAVQSGQQLIPF